MNQNNEERWKVFFTEEVIMEVATLTQTSQLETRVFLYQYLPSIVSYPLFVASLMRWRTIAESQQVDLATELLEHKSGDMMAVMDVVSTKFIKGDYLKQ